MNDTTQTCAPSALIGDSPRMIALRRQIERYAPARLPVLVHGPTGSGKELVAAAMHRLSGRSGALVAVNTCAIAETMVEDAFFGHVRGAFTGAVGDVPGFLAEANGGTVFLDEIGSLGIGTQAKLLRALETGQFRAVGSARDRISDFRIVSASNEEIEHLVEAGRFRRDLAHRLAGVIIEVPALSEHREDIPALVRHFLNDGGCTLVPEVTDAALAMLCEYRWPGNVRQLRHVIERARLLSHGDTISRNVISECLGPRPGHCGSRYDRDTGGLLRALESCAWDTIAAAEQLGVHRATVYRRLQRLGVSIPERGALRP